MLPRPMSSLMLMMMMSMLMVTMTMIMMMIMMMMVTEIQECYLWPMMIRRIPSSALLRPKF